MVRDHERGGDDDFSVDKLLVESRVLTLLVGGGHQRVALVLEPLAQAELILGGTQKLGLLLGVLKPLEKRPDQPLSQTTRCQFKH